MIKIKVKYIMENLTHDYTVDNLESEDWVDMHQYHKRYLSDEEMKMYVINTINKKELLMAKDVRNEVEYICTWNISSFSFQ